MGMGKPVDKHLQMAGISVHIDQQVNDLIKGFNSVFTGFEGFGSLKVFRDIIQALLFGGSDC